MRLRRSATITAALLLLVVACGSEEPAATTQPVTSGVETTTTAGDTTTTAETTTTAPITTTTAATTTTAEETTTTAETTTTTAGTTTTGAILTTIAAGAFDFAAGTSPRFALSIALSTDGPEGPFVPAGEAPGPDVTAGDSLWAQFIVENATTSATITELAVTLPDVSPDNLCPEPAQLAPGAAITCVSPEFTAEAGAQVLPVTVTAAGFRQGENFEDVIDPPLPFQLAYDEVPYSFAFVLEVSEEVGVRLEGSSNQPFVIVDLAEISLDAPLAVDCSDSFDSGFSDGSGSPGAGEPRVVAHVITIFDAAGTVVDECGFIPAVELEFLGVADNPEALHYVGG